MTEDPHPGPLDAGTPVPGALDHAWIVVRLDQQHSGGADGARLWTVRVRCVQCGVQADFRAGGIPPCRPQGAPP